MPPASKIDDAPVFGRRLREAREAADLPQDKLGARIGIDEGSASVRISRYETGVHEPAVAIAGALARQLGVPLAYLYCAEDDLARVILRWSKMNKSQRRSLAAWLDENSPK